ncbi:AMP-binding enzyme family protein [Mycobacterium xenopi 3993]|nr:AMP-binding enzyme family protein [Mycobacterium xenopi 3993]
MWPGDADVCDPHRRRRGQYPAGGPGWRDRHSQSRQCDRLLEPPEQTAETFRPDGLRTGDLGYLDDENYLHITGRKTDMIISGGFNVYPAEIERVIGRHDGSTWWPWSAFPTPSGARPGSHGRA